MFTRLFSFVQYRIVPVTQRKCFLCNSPTNTTTVKTIGKKHSAQKLEELFDIRRYDALEIVSNNKKLCNVPVTHIQNNYNIFVNRNIKAKQLLQFPEALAAENVEQKLKDLKNLPFEIEKTFPLVALKTIQVLKAINEEKCNKRIEHISLLLDSSINETCQMLARRPFLITSDLHIIENNVKILLEYGISLEDIKHDLWVLRYNSDTITDRLEIAKQSNSEILKTWMVRAQLPHFYTYLRRQTDNREILGDSSLSEYLSKKLCCTDSVIQILISKHPQLKSKSLKKVEKMIDFLYNQGFSPIHIIKVPKILLHSVETTRKRLLELEALGFKVDSLSVLTKSQKQYMMYYENLVKCNKSKNTNIPHL